MSHTSHPVNCRPGQANGERRKDATLDLVTALVEQFAVVGQRALLPCSMANGTVNAHQVLQHLELPHSINPVCRLGAVSGPVAETGFVERARYITTCRQTADEGPVTIRPNVAPAKPEAWLRYYPDVAADRLYGQKSSWLAEFDSTNRTNPSVSILGCPQTKPNQSESRHDESQADRHPRQRRG